MTLIISIASPKGLWQCSDVRLSLNGNPLSKPGMKHIRLNCHDGRALIGYSGVGKVGEIEISKWVRQALRGYKGGIEDTLKMLTDLANSELNK